MTYFFRAEHAVLVSTGIGVTPFSSILQSIMYRYRSSKRECPRCQLRWITDLSNQMQSLRKVDFVWINRDQKSFEWFLNLLSEMEAEQLEEEHSDYTNTNGRFLDLHLYFTQALARNDMRAVGMHLAMDLLHRKVKGQFILGGSRSHVCTKPNNYGLTIYEDHKVSNTGILGAKIQIISTGSQEYFRRFR